jgi:alcohol dehydrogenase
MACGDKKALPALAILDADLTATQPAKVAAMTAIDAVAHAVETAGCSKANDISRSLSRQAWTLLNSSFERAIRHADDAEAREKMLLGAHLAGAAIENSMLGAAHAAANPLTANFGIAHGAAVGLMLPHVIRFNAEGANPYGGLEPDAEQLAQRVEAMQDVAALPRRLAEYSVRAADIERLAVLGAQQWTAEFNPRPVDQASFREIYQRAL